MTHVERLIEVSEMDEREAQQPAANRNDGGQIPYHSAYFGCCNRTVMTREDIAQPKFCPFCGKAILAKLGPEGGAVLDGQLSEAQIKYMVNRFLAWRLPENFNPDAGISFKRNFNEHSAYPMKHEPTGTNLFDAVQTEQMIRYLLDGMPSGEPSNEKPQLTSQPQGKEHP